MTRLWHPFASLGVSGRETVLVRGEGVWLWDSNATRYLDGTAGLWFCQIGHGRQELAAAGYEQMKVLETYSTFGDLATSPAILLAERLCDLAAMPGAMTFLTGGGSESIDTAAKIVRMYWNLVDKPERSKLAFREGAYHGMNAFGTSLGGIPANRLGFGRLVEEVIQLPADDVEGMTSVLRASQASLAGVFVEPLRAAAGVYPTDDAYWLRLNTVCHELDVPIIVDEVVTGFGRLGSWFASSDLPLEPSIIVCAKGVTSGYAPLGAVIVSERVVSAFADSEVVFRHGYSYSGHATACAIALCNLNLIEDEAILTRVNLAAGAFHRGLRTLESHPLVAAVRTCGLAGAVELDPGAVEARGGLDEEVVHHCRAEGILSRSLLGRALQVSPPLTITDDEMQLLVAGFATALDRVAI